MRLARRVEQLPPYLFARISELIAEQRAAGVDVISLGIGDPDLPTPPHVLAALQQAAEDPANHRYPRPRGCPSSAPPSHAGMRDAMAWSWTPSARSPR